MTSSSSESVSPSDDNETKPFSITPFQLTSLSVPFALGISKAAMGLKGGLSVIPNAFEISLCFVAAFLYALSLAEGLLHRPFWIWFFRFDLWPFIVGFSRGFWEIILAFPAVTWKILTAPLSLTYAWLAYVGLTLVAGVPLIVWHFSERQTEIWIVSLPPSMIVTSIISCLRYLTLLIPGLLR
ncbi:hypothetical protein DL93DRAFT_2157958 [Clavulina sp. PMI_390]|nr:hypothetical protein DL93DRAFT_2157958 [Clavulina sp. PMI_390]